MKQHSSNMSKQEKDAMEECKRLDNNDNWIDLFT